MTDYQAAGARAYAEGRREQRCPYDGREETGGSYCTACGRPVHPDTWTNDTAKSRAGRAANASKAGEAAFGGLAPRQAPMTPDRPPPPPATILAFQHRTAHPARPALSVEGGLWPAP